jgi:hypothetical protein
MGPSAFTRSAVARLSNRVGEHKLYRAAPVTSDAPERSVRHIPAMAPETGAEWQGHWPRPSLTSSIVEPSGRLVPGSVVSAVSRL